MPRASFPILAGSCRRRPAEVPCFRMSRPLPPLQPLVDAHSDVHLLWDERLSSRALLAVGNRRSLTVHAPERGAWAAWQAFVTASRARGEWVFGWIGYDMHEGLALAEPAAKPHLPSPHPGEWPLLHWVVPEVVLEWPSGATKPKVVQGAGSELALSVLATLDEAGPTAREARGAEAEADEAHEASGAGAACARDKHGAGTPASTPLTPGWSKDTYVTKFNDVHRALKRGDLYEMNLCMPWHGTLNGTESWATFERLATATRAPHSAYLQAGPWRMLSASPERFVERRGNTLRSQPVKGTVRRGNTDDEDAKLAEAMQASEKERAENVMIVDLVRNDLSRVATPRSVDVEELFGLRTLATVHQLVSTVRCEVSPNVSELDILTALFPMGSMTGAPKLSAMDCIARVEETGRGVYSGTVGYVAPSGDFDLNVVIRTLLHNAETGRVDATVGGAITLLADAEQEHAECLLKAEALRTCLAP